MTPKPRTKPDRTPLERMTDLTRRLVQVPKSEIPTKRKKPKRKNH
jgi:hypothetical protein